jgi:hypothetical protein
MVILPKGLLGGSTAIQEWIAAVGAKTADIAPGRPWESDNVILPASYKRPAFHISHLRAAVDTRDVRTAPCYNPADFDIVGPSCFAVAANTYRAPSEMTGAQLRKASRSHAGCSLDRRWD